MTQSQTQKNQSNKTQSASLPQDEMAAYFRRIKSFPLLEPDEEYDLAIKWFEKQDEHAARKLITSHLRLVAKIAAGYKGYGLPMADLIAEGNIGILNAMKKFDPQKGFRFSTYAMWWIRASIQEYILRTWSLVKIGTTSAQKKLFFNLRKTRREISEADDSFQSMSNEDIEKIAQRLNVKESEVREMEERLDRGGDSSLNIKTSKESEGSEWQDWIEADEPSQEQELIERDEYQKYQDILNGCLQYLKPREIKVIEGRRLKEPPATLEEISQELGLSKERVRQIEDAAFHKLRLAVKDEMRKRGMLKHNNDEMD